MAKQEKRISASRLAYNRLTILWGSLKNLLSKKDVSRFIIDRNIAETNGLDTILADTRDSVSVIRRDAGFVLVWRLRVAIGRNDRGVCCVRADRGATFSRQVALTPLVLQHATDTVLDTRYNGIQFSCKLSEKRAIACLVAIVGKRNIAGRWWPQLHRFGSQEQGINHLSRLEPLWNW